MGVGLTSAAQLVGRFRTRFPGLLAGGPDHGKGWDIAWHRQQSR